MPAFYAAADLMVWPAVREAYGLALLEAQAAGLPVVAGREGGVEEVVRDGVTGLLTPPREPAAFARAVEELLRAPERRRAMGAAALRFVAGERSLAQAAADARCGARRGRGHPGGAAMTRLLLIRHGADGVERQPPHAGPRRPRSVGRGRAEVLRWRLPAGWDGACWLTSPLRRARETAALLTAGPVVVEPRLIEMDWGAWEGRSKAELRAAAGEELAAQEALRARSQAARRREPARGRRTAQPTLVAELDALPAPVVAVMSQWRDPRRARARDRLGHAMRAAAAAAARPGAGAGLPAGRRSRAAAAAPAAGGLSDAGAVLGPAPARQRPSQARRDAGAGDGGAAASRSRW